MNKLETSQALALAQAYDRRTVGEMDVLAWQKILGGLPYDDVVQAITDWYSETSEWIMPVNVRVGVAKIDKARKASPWAPGQQGIPKESAFPTATLPAPGQRNGADLCRYVLARLKDAGSDPANGKLLGKDMCGDIAYDAAQEWLKQTAPSGSQ